MKRIIAFIFCISIILFVPCTAFADGDGNMDGGGGGMEGGTGSNFWHPGEDGVRVAVVRAKDNQVVSTPIDLTNKNESNVLAHFGKVSKLHYRNGRTLTPSQSKYTYTNPSKALPSIISDHGNANIAAIKHYFCSEETLKKLASIINVSYDTLINGNYKLLIEPIAYFTFNGQKMAMTATEAALYDQRLSGGLRSKMVSLTHQNLPLSIFLEKSDLGYPAFSGSANKAQSNATIISSLGLGVVKFKEDSGSDGGSSGSDGSTGSGGSANVEYRVNTDVITSVTLNAGAAITPDKPASVTFRINGGTYTVTNIVIPEGESQLVWVKWHTPKTPQTVNITASASNGSLNISTITAKIVSLNNNLPPDPTAKDRNDSFTTPSLPSRTQLTGSSWGVWSAVWVPNWVWHENWKWVENSSETNGGHWTDNGKWIDEGNWQFSFKSYHATLSARMNLLPDDKVPSAVGKRMPSGYGVKISVNSELSTAAPAAYYTAAQTAVTYFPEFAYNTYWRLLDLTANGSSSQLSFQTNIYSTYNRRVHFTPLWYPDGKYTVYAYLQDAWTPSGMLSMNLDDYVSIKGNVYDNWHIGPKLVD